MTDVDTVAHSPALIVLRPGDRVLVTMNEDPDGEDGQEYLEALHGQFPGVSFTLLGNVAGVLVLPAPPEPKYAHVRGS